MGFTISQISYLGYTMHTAASKALRSPEEKKAMNWLCGKEQSEQNTQIEKEIEYFLN